MSFSKNIFLLALVAFQSGCGAGTPVKTMQAATLSKHSPATTQVLNQAVSRALNGTRVSLASRALTKRSEVTVERMMQSSELGNGLNGRIMSAPVVHRFSLKKQSGACYLVHQKTGQSYLLEGVECQVL